MIYRKLTFFILLFSNSALLSGQIKHELGIGTFNMPYYRDYRYLDNDTLEEINRSEKYLSYSFILNYQRVDTNDRFTRYYLGVGVHRSLYQGVIYNPLNEWKYSYPQKALNLVVGADKGKFIPIGKYDLSVYTGLFFTYKTKSTWTSSFDFTDLQNNSDYHSTISTSSPGHLFTTAKLGIGLRRRFFDKLFLGFEPYVSAYAYAVNGVQKEITTTYDDSGTLISEEVNKTRNRGFYFSNGGVLNSFYISLFYRF